MNANDELLSAALLGYEQKARELQAKIEDVRQRLRGPRVRSTPNADLAGGASSPKRHKISAEGRARIAAAQRKRWALAKAGGKKSKALAAA